MAYVLIRHKRFLSSHGYATGLGYSFKWSPNESDARRFSDNDPRVDFFKNATGARIEHRVNTRSELRLLGREAMAILRRRSDDSSIHARINARAKRVARTSQSSRPGAPSRPCQPEFGASP